MFLNVHMSFCSGTASVTVAGLLAAEHVTGKAITEGVYLFQGAGEVTMNIP